MKRSRTIIVALICGLASAPFIDSAEAQTGARAITPADWPMYNHDLAGWRFNPAEGTLNTSNVGKLIERWRFPAKDSKETIGVVHATPTVVAGEVYFGTATFPSFYKLGTDGTLK